MKPASILFARWCRPVGKRTLSTCSRKPLDSGFTRPREVARLLLCEALALVFALGTAPGIAWAWLEVASVHPCWDDFSQAHLGKVMISTLHDNVYYTVVKTTKANTVAQTADGKVKITAYVEPVQAGVTVYFAVIDPDPDDLSSYEPDTNRGDNHATVNKAGSLSAGSALTEIKTINGVQRAAAEVELTFTNRYAGDNYRVMASTHSDFTNAYLTAVLRAWKRLYVEEDQMYKTGTDLTADVAAGSNQITVEDASWISVGNTLLLFDADHPDGENVTVSAKNGSTLTLSAGLTNSYNAGYSAGDKGAAVAKPGDGVYDADVTTRTDDAFGFAADGSDGGAFVEIKKLSDGEGCVPYQPVLGDQTSPGLLHYSNKWFKNRLKANYIYVVGARYCNAEFQLPYGGANEMNNYQATYVQKIEDDYPGSQATANADATAHEFGHQFNLASVDWDHPDVWCHLGPNTAYCIMDWDTSLVDAYSEFCHDAPNHVDAVRDATDPR